jgi:nucleoid-associated protein EbfC
MNVVLSMLGNPFQKLIESQVGAIQENLQKAMQELETATVESTVGGGVVSCKMTGGGQLLEVKIDPCVVNADDVELLEDLVATAVRDCQARAAQLKREKIMAATPLGAMGVQLPDVF